MSRLPEPGSDEGSWGEILNDFLSQSLKPNGLLKDGAVTSNVLAVGSVTGASIASNAVNASSITNGSITEQLLDSGVVTKLNATGGAVAWGSITGMPAVIAAGSTQAAAVTVLGLSNVDDTSDASKPISTATQTALDAKAALVHTHTALQISDSTAIGRSILTAADASTVKSQLALAKSDIGLDNTDNTSDINKPISTAAQTALNAKADLVGGLIPTAQLPSIALSDTFTVANQASMLALTTSQVQLGDIAVRTDGAGTFILTSADPSVLSSWTLLNMPTDLVVSVNGQVGTVVLAKADVGLGNIDNTSDLNKPISTAAQSALTAKADLVGGSIPTSQIPALALMSVVTAASQAAMLALTTAQVQPGDIAVRTDGTGTFILTSADPSVLSSWTLLNSPTDTVTSVNGQVGTVSLTKTDVGLANVDNTSDAAKNSATVTLTNKTIDGGTNTLQNIPQSAVTGLTAAMSSNFARNIATVTTAATLGATTGTDYVAFVGSGGAPTLPTALGNSSMYTIKNIDTGAHTVATTSSQTIDGSATISITPNSSVDILSDGTNWRII